MGITRGAIESILKEYEETRQSHAQERDARIAEIDRLIPQYLELDSQITSLFVRRSMLRLKAEDGLSDDELKKKISELSERKASLLESAGFSASDLELSYTCPLCKDTGYLENGAMCKCFKARIIEKLYDFSHIRGILKRENFSTFNFKYYDGEKAVDANGSTALDVAKDAVRISKEFIADFNKAAGNLFLSGGTGVGKTFLSNCIAKELIEQGHSCIYLSAVRFFDILADSTFSRGEEGDLPAKLIYDCDLLIIDDLGTEMINSFVQTQLFNCINERIIRQKSTIISANLSAKDLQEKYSERVFSRVISNYTIIKLYARDIRIQKALED